MSKALICAFLLSIVMLCAATLMYVNQFAKNGFSDNPSDWGAFADYLNVFVSLSSLILLTTLTYYIHTIDRKRQHDADEDEKARSRPIIIFYLNQNSKWAIKNVGNGVALNIFLLYTTNAGASKKQVKIYSLLPGIKKELSYSAGKGVIKWEATYYDFQGNVCSSIYKNDETEILPKEKVLPCKDGEYVRVNELSDLSSL